MKSKINILIAIVLLISGSFACGISAPKYIQGSAKSINLTLDEMNAFDFAPDNLSVGADGLYKYTITEWIVVHIQSCENLESFSSRYFVPVHFLVFKGKGTIVTVTVYKDSKSAQKCFDKISNLFIQTVEQMKKQKTSLYDFMENPIESSDATLTLKYERIKMFDVYYLKGNVIGHIQTYCVNCAVTIAKKVIEKIPAP